MNGSDPLDDDFAPQPDGGRGDASLPPIQPPSAGFIIQLFVVPALIVAAVIGVYLLFGKLASSEVDWRELVSDLRSTNPHTRWRGAYGLAQLLEADALRTRTATGKSPPPAPAAGESPTAVAQPMAKDPELAAELAAAFQEARKRPDTEDDDHRRLLEYVIKALGWMDVPQVVFPTLRSAMTPDQSPWLRQQALIAIGMAAGRAFQNGQPVDDPQLTQDLIALTDSETGLLKHLATFYLGFLPDPAAQTRLRLLLSDGDLKTRFNAAVGVARNGSLESLPIFEGILTDAAQRTFDPKDVHDETAAGAYFEREQLVSNALTFVTQSAERFSAEQRRHFHTLAEPLTHVADSKISHLAIDAIYALDQAGEPSAP